MTARAVLLYLGNVALLTAAYYGSGSLGLAFPQFDGNICLLWPPAGIALAAMILGGVKYWPGVFLGVLLINLRHGTPLSYSPIIAATNALGPVLGAYWLRSVFDFRTDFARQKDLFAFLSVGAIGSMAVGATGGVFALWLADIVPTDSLRKAWAIWWMGDTMGVLLAAPPILTFHYASIALFRNAIKRLETWILLGVLSSIALVVFQDLFSLGEREMILAFLPFPILIWIALRTDVLTASLANLILSCIAILGTATGLTPFARGDDQMGLLILWVYLGTVSLMTLLVTALQAERVAAEEHVLNSKLELETIFRALPDLYFRMNSEGVILDFRATDLHDLYVAPSLFLGRRMQDVVPAEVAKQIAAAMAQALSQREAVELEYALPRDRGRQDFEARFVSMADDQVLAVVRNITERKHAVQDLRRSEARFRAFMENTPAIAYVKDAQGRYVYANRRWEAQFPSPRLDWLGNDDYAFWPMETASLFRASDQLLLDSRKTVEKSESGPVPGGEVRHWFTLKFLLDSDIGEPLIGGVTLDITQAKRLEEQLRQSQKMEAVGQLAGGVAHDFNNLLTIINGYSSFMLASAGNDHPWQSFLKDILHSGERAADLTRQLLAFSRKQILQPSVVDINQIIEENGKMLRRTLGDHLRLVTTLAPYLPLVKIDPGQLEQAIVNMAVNARDAMPVGGDLTLATSIIPYDPAAAPAFAGMMPVAHVLLRIADTGTGMDAATRARVFEPFFTTKGVGKGTGLGLSMVYGFVQQSGGHIDVVSEPGQGTRFDILLPTCSEPSQKPQAKLLPAPMPRGDETILLVEDEAAVRSLARTILESCGYTVVEAHHGKEAIAIAARYTEPLHLLLTDMQMPQLNGRLLADQLTAERPHLKVLFISGFAESELSDHGVVRNRFPLLEKPFSPTGLANRVRETLDGVERN